jgi:hypothetical protein
MMKGDDRVLLAAPLTGRVITSCNEHVECSISTLCYHNHRQHHYGFNVSISMQNCCSCRHHHNTFVIFICSFYNVPSFLSKLINGHCILSQGSFRQMCWYTVIIYTWSYFTALASLWSALTHYSPWATKISQFHRTWKVMKTQLQIPDFTL